jgi:D-amino peptidase
MHPEQAREVIREAARLALERVGTASAPAIELPATLTVRMRNPDLAEMAGWISGVEQDPADPVTIRITDQDPIRLYRTFVTVVLLTRGIAE